MVSTLTEYAVRKKKIHDWLGGCCTKCGSKENIQIDHVDHTNKNFDVMQNWAIAWDRLVVELAICQLLCESCHLAKSVNEGSLAKGWTTQPRLVHGTYWCWYKHKCRCDLCLTAAPPPDPRDMTEEKQALIVDLRLSGMSSYEIAEETGISRNTVMKYWGTRVT